MQVLISLTFLLSVAVGPPFKPRQLSPFDARKAEQLLRARYPCLGCHELNGIGGKIGPSLTDIAGRRSADYVYAMIDDPQSTVPGSAMPRVPMDLKTRELIANALLRVRGASTISSPGPPAPPRPPPATGGDAAALYGRLCAACHGTTGGGDGFNAAFLPVRPAVHASAVAMSARSDDALFDTIFAGGYVMNRSNFMPPYGSTLTRDQIRSLVGYIRALCHCEGPAWSRDNR